MSLQVWLPLNGDLRNYGLDGSGFFINNSAVWGTGKIGSKAYLTSTGTNIATFSSLAGVKEFSIAYWLKIDSSLTFSNYLDFWQVWYTNQTGTNVIRDEHTNTVGKHLLELYKENNVGSNTNTYWPCSVDSAENIWVHIVLTKNLTLTKTYCNGVLKLTLNNTVYESTTGSLTGDIRIGNATCGAYLNDFRIYDHCLSYKEVKEIAKGLVLHYPLNKPMPNLLKNSLPHTTGNWSTAGTDWSTSIITESDGILTAKTSYSGTSLVGGGTHHPCGVSAKTDLENGLIYTLSAWIRASKNCICTFHNELMTTSHTINVTTNWLFYKYSCIIDTSRNYWSNVVYVRAADVVLNMWVEVRLMKLELSDHFTGWIPNTSDPLYSALGYDSGIEPDCSGYKRDGIITGTLTAAADTPRYRTSSYFPSGANYINAGRGAMVTDAITVNLWVKYSTWGNPISCTEGGGWNFENNNGGIRFAIYTVDNTYRMAQTSIAPSSLINNWHMLTGTYDGENVKLYIDGKEEGTLAASTAHKDIKYNSSNVLFIGAEASNNVTTPASTSFIGNISDVRVYATALSADDIKALYTDAGYVDKNGNFHAYEFVEE